MTPWRAFLSNFHVFETHLGQLESQIPNSFRKSRPRTASHAKPACRKWSHTNYLSMRFSIKRVTKSRKPMIFRSVFNFFEKVCSFFETHVFHFKLSEASFSWDHVSCLKAVGKSQMVVGKYKPEPCRDLSWGTGLLRLGEPPAAAGGTRRGHRQHLTLRGCIRTL